MQCKEHNRISLNDLDTLALVHIFSYLDTKDQCSARQVCRMWKELGEEPSIWKFINFGRYDNNKLELWSDVVTRHSSVRSIQCHQSSDEFLRKVVYRCPSLTGLKLTQHVMFDPTTMEDLFNKHCPRLQRLELPTLLFNRQINQSYPSIVNFKTLKRIHINESLLPFQESYSDNHTFPELEYVYLENFRSDPRWLIQRISPSLKSFSYAYNSSIMLDFQPLLNQLSSCRNLQILRLTVPSLDDGALSSLSKGCKKLKEFSLGLRNQAFSRKLFTRLYFRNVSYLFIAMPLIHPKFATEISTAFPNLEILDLVRLNAIKTHPDLQTEDVLHLITKCVRLTKLHITNFPCIDDSSFLLPLGLSFRHRRFVDLILVTLHALVIRTVRRRIFHNTVEFSERESSLPFY